MGMLGRGGIFTRQNLLASIGSLILTSEENDRLLMGSKMGRYKRVNLTPPHLSPFPFTYPYTVMASIMKKHSYGDLPGAGVVLLG